MKGLGVQLGYPVIQELPYSPELILTEEQWKEVIEYNLVHDLGILELLTIEKNNDILQRQDAKNKYGFNCFSWDGVKLGINILLETYCKETGKRMEDIKHLRTPMTSINIKDIILDRIEFRETKLDYQYKKDYILCNSFYSLLQHLKSRTVTGTTELSYSVILDGVKYDIKSGGLHSYHQNEIIEPDPNKYYYRDVDASSYYPSSGAIFGFVPTHLPGSDKVLLQLKNERVLDKKEGRTKDAELKKLALNGGYYGNLNNEYTPLYDPKQLLSVTINGQLLLLMMCEKFIEAEIKIDMCNTDRSNCDI